MGLESRFPVIFTCIAIGLVFLVASCTKAPVESKIVQLRPEGVKKTREQRKLTQIERWRQLLQENRNASIDQKLVSVNEFFNNFDHIEDRYLWGRDDYWATLPETLRKSGGDCEDVAIAKYFTLLDLDIPEESLRITYVISLKTNRPHMVLAYARDLSQEMIVLDTMNNYLFPVSRRSDLVPVYSFNSKGYWLARKQEGWQGERLGSPERLSMWSGLLQRMKTDGEWISGS